MAQDAVRAEDLNWPVYFSLARYRFFCCEVFLTSVEGWSRPGKRRLDSSPNYM